MQLNKTKLKYIATHTLVGALVGIPLLPISPFACAYTALVWLVAKETGEIIGKLKERKQFKNTLRENLRALWAAVKTDWQLMQTVLPSVIVLIIMGVIKYVY